MEERINRALAIAYSYSQIDGGHHKAWTIDQMVRALLNEEHEDVCVTGSAVPLSELSYQAFVRFHNDGEDGPDTYSWDDGIAP